MLEVSVACVKLPRGEPGANKGGVFEAETYCG
jgi:hypothetical protein